MKEIKEFQKMEERLKNLYKDFSKKYLKEPVEMKIEFRNKKAQAKTNPNEEGYSILMIAKDKCVPIAFAKENELENDLDKINDKTIILWFKVLISSIDFYNVVKKDKIGEIEKEHKSQERRKNILKKNDQKSR